MVSRVFVLACFLATSCVVSTQAQSSVNQTLSPPILPGKGLAEHDFMYAGESHDRNIFIVRQGKIIWNYDAPAGYEVHTAVPIGKDRVLYIQNGDPAVIRVVNIVTNVVEREITLQTRRPASTHGQFRHARLTDRGTLLVAHMDLNKVVEYDYNGNELWSFPGSGPWGVKIG